MEASAFIHPVERRGRAFTLIDLQLGWLSRHWNRCEIAQAKIVATIRDSSQHGSTTDESSNLAPGSSVDDTDGKSPQM